MTSRVEEHVGSGGMFAGKDTDQVGKRAVRYGIENFLGTADGTANLGEIVDRYAHTGGRLVGKYTERFSQ
jgi:hypothetical protein